MLTHTANESKIRNEKHTSGMLKRNDVALLTVLTRMNQCRSAAIQVSDLCDCVTGDIREIDKPVAQLHRSVRKSSYNKFEFDS